jgi:hypothetical protein
LVVIENSLIFVSSLKTNQMDYSKYNNPIEYPKRPSKPVAPNSSNPQDFINHAKELEAYAYLLQKHKTCKEEYDKYSALKQQEFQVDAIEEVGLTGHPLAERAFGYAWDEGHYAGFPEVFSKLTCVAEMILGDSSYTPEKAANPMRDRLLLRLENIRKEQKYFLNSTIRWKNATYGDVHLSNVNFEELTDAELLDIYEMIIRRLYVQM